MGVKSGEEGGRKSSSQPRAARASRMPAAADGRSDDPARPPAPAAGSAPAPPRGTSGRSPSPSPSRSARARAGRRGSMPPPTGCSSRGCAAPIRSPVGGGAPTQPESRVKAICVPLSSTKTNRWGSSWATASRQAVRASSSRSLAASDFFSASSPGGAGPATSLPRSPAARGARPTRRSAPVPWHPAPLPAARRIASCSPRIARGRPGIGLRARPSHAVARRRASPWSPPPYSGERLLAGADRPPPLAPSVLSGRSNRHACPSVHYVSCLPLFFARCCSRRDRIATDGKLLACLSTLALKEMVRRREHR